MSSVQTHSFYPFLHFGKRDDLIEPVGFLDEPAAPNKWVVVADVNSSSRRLKEFDVAPTIADAEAFLFSDDCRGVVESRRLQAMSLSDWNLAIALSSERRFSNDAVTVQMTSTIPKVDQSLPQAAALSYRTRPDDDERSRLSSAIGSHLWNDILVWYDNFTLAMASAEVTSLSATLEQVDSMAASVERGLEVGLRADLESALSRIESIRPSPASSVESSLAMVVKAELERHCTAAKHGLTSSVETDGVKGHITSAVLRASIRELIGLLNALRTDDGLDEDSLEVFSSVTGRLHSMNDYLNFCRNEHDGTFDVDAAIRWIEESREGEEYLRYTSPYVWRAVENVFNAFVEAAASATQSSR